MIDLLESLTYLKRIDGTKLNVNCLKFETRNELSNIKMISLHKL